MKKPLYDVILGNIPGVRNSEYPDVEWVNRMYAVQTRQQARKTEIQITEGSMWDW